MTLASPKTKKFTSYIGGEWVEPESGKSVPNINPANGESLGDVMLASRADTKRAIELAAKAFPGWKATPAPVRGNYFFKVVRLMEERREELARALTLEEGKLYKEALGEVQKTINIVEFIAGEGRRMSGETTPSEMPNTFAYTIKQPLGVVGLITPWNFPVAIPMWKIAPALVAGNTVVLKPATNTPWTASLLMEIMHDAGIPAGVINMVVGKGSEVGDEIVNNPTVRALSFTGSNEVGQGLYLQGAQRGVKVQCEMGGKNPIVVLEDADIDLAVEATIQGAFGSTGQRCTATSRAIVVHEIADQFVEKLVARTKKFVVGDGMKDGVHMGPSVDEGQMNTVLEGIEKAKESKAKLLLGGGRLTEGEFAKGYFIQPTLFDHVSRDDFLANEELFGPVLAVIRVKDLHEALEVANSVRYGLSSSIYTFDTNRVFRFIDEIETGITHVNSPTMGGEAQLPFGGVKATGVGTREQGKVAIDFFTELKTVYVDYTGEKRETNIY
ncbi:MAG: aldehyde dehydrogenase family protein [Candidatus Eremiobacteraeota bacterium]|nr:aldehyde dehydrogenase family protein [Candidatus Eremiobacteraeota bacterium]